MTSRHLPAFMAALVTLAALAGCGSGEDAGSPRHAAVLDDAAPAEPPGPPAPEVQAALRAVLDAAIHPWLKWQDISSVLPYLEALYQAEPDGLFWFRGEAGHPALAGAIGEIGDAAATGFDPDDYDATLLADRYGAMLAGSQPAAGDRALLDLAVTVSAMRLLSAAHQGRVDPRLVGFDHDPAARTLDLAALLRYARDGGGLAAAIAAAEPQFPVYRRLVKALADYRAIAVDEPPLVPSLPAGRNDIEPGDAWAGATALAQRLRAFGDLTAEGLALKTDDDDVPIYGDSLVEAVRGFQQRHGLDGDGSLGAGTITALNVPAAMRARQIELALERVRWLPGISREPLVFVNVPMLRLWAYDPQRPDEPLRMQVTAGDSAGHAAPIFIGEMASVIFRPYWYPSPGMIRAEVVPLARRDPSYMAAQHLEIVADTGDNALGLPVTAENLDQVLAGGLFVRQTPGGHSALGLAKFVFANAEDVYLHGMPAAQPFSRDRRDHGHGCIRVEDPAVLAEWVLRDESGWNLERVRAAMRGATPTRVALAQQLRVIIFYDTAYVDHNGVVYLADDYYGHDARLEKALAHGYPYPRMPEPEPEPDAAAGERT